MAVVVAAFVPQRGLARDKSRLVSKINHNPRHQHTTSHRGGWDGPVT